jgi:L-glyceraldehyde 3-phosphate reductase
MPRDELIISTKAGFYMWQGPYGDWGSKKYLVTSLDQSLKRLGLDYVDIFYHHRPDPETPLEETLSALDLIVKQGKALYIGLSNYRGERFKQAIDIIKLHDWSPVTIHQPSYNMFDRWIESDLLPYTDEAGTGIIAFVPLAQGILTDRYLNGLPQDSRMGKRGEAGKEWYEKQKSAGVWDKVAKLNEIAINRGQTMAQLAITWILRDQRITSVLIGASRVSQLDENIKAIQAPSLTDEELQKIENIIQGK